MHLCALRRNFILDFSVDSSLSFPFSGAPYVGDPLPRDRLNINKRKNEMGVIVCFKVTVNDVLMGLHV